MHCFFGNSFVNTLSLSVVRSNASVEVCDVLHSNGEKLINMELVPFSIMPMVVSFP